MISDERREEIRQSAEDHFVFLEEFIAAGFTEEQAMSLMTRPTVNMSAIPPEMSEWFTKMNLTMDKEL